MGQEVKPGTSLPPVQSCGKLRTTWILSKIKLGPIHGVSPLPLLEAHGMCGLHAM